MMAQNNDMPDEIRDKINALKEQYYTKGSIVREITKDAGSKKQAKLFVEAAYSESRLLDLDDPARVNIRSKLDTRTGFMTIALSMALIFFIPTAGVGGLMAGIILLGFGAYHKLKYKKIISQKYSSKDDRQLEQ